MKRNCAAYSTSTPGLGVGGYYFIPLLLIFLVPFEGWWFHGDNGKLFTNLFFLIICLAFIRVCAFTRFSVLIMAISLLLLISALVNSLYSPYHNIQKDILFYMRSLVFGGVVYYFFYRSPVNLDVVFIRRISLFCWLLVTFSIFSSALFSYGFYTYEEFSAGRKFYFPSVNEVNFVYFLLNLMVCLFYRSFFFRVLVFCCGLGVYLIVGNKSFIALYFIAIVTLVFLWFSFWVRLVSVFFVIITVLLCVLFPVFLNGLLEVAFQVFSYVLGGVSGGAEKFVVKSSYLSPFSALVSERDVLYLIGHDIFFSDVDVFRVLLGMSYGVYGSLYAMRRGGEFSFSEIDPVDLFFSYGLVGVFLLLLIFSRLLITNGGAFSKPRIVLILVFFCAGLMTGHIYGYVFPVFFFAMYLGLLTPRSR